MIIRGVSRKTSYLFVQLLFCTQLRRAHHDNLTWLLLSQVDSALCRRKMTLCRRKVTYKIFCLLTTWTLIYQQQNVRYICPGSMLNTYRLRLAWGTEKHSVRWSPLIYEIAGTFSKIGFRFSEYSTKKGETKNHKMYLEGTSQWTDALPINLLQMKQ